ncbi:MAG TPA: helix-turn-helix transcriptional regulator, partial [Leptolinea sp.]
LTQYDLAELAKIPLVTLQKIEQGRQKNLSREMVLNLANALNLTTRAKVVFFQTSLGIKDSEFIKSTVSPQETLGELAYTLFQLQTPAFVADAFGDIVFSNRAIPVVYRISENQLANPQLLSQYNINRILFSPEFDKQRAMLGENVHDFSRRMILLYKMMTLKSRNHWCFQRLLPELNRFSLFREHWQSPNFHNEDVFNMYNVFHLKHPQLGSLKYLLTVHQTLTASGDLYVYNFLPMDAHTAEVCQRVIKRVGTGVVPLSSWPKPNAPEKSLTNPQ